MAVITGTATGLKNLLAAVRTAALANGWTSNSYTTAGAAPNTDMLLLKGPGYGVGYNVFLGIRTYEDATNSHYSLESRGYTNYTSGLTWNSQPGASPNTVFTNLWDTSMPYWLYISDRRILLVVKCSNSYHSLYAGFFNPFADPTQYPYPFYLAGDASAANTYGDLSYNSRSVAFPGNNAAFVREPAGLWRDVTVYNSNSTWGIQGIDQTAYTIWPYNTPAAQSGSDDDADGGNPPNIGIAPLPSTTDTMFLCNAYIMGCYDLNGVLGVLEGVYWIPGNLMSVEQALTYNSQTYRVFCGLSRSVEVPSQFYAVIEV